MAKTTKELKAVFDNVEECFGKLFDGKADECKKCADTTECAAWQEAEGDPSKKKAAPAAAGKKTVPAAKKDEKPATSSKPAVGAKKDEKAATKPAVGAKKDEKAATKPAAEKKAAPPKAERERDVNGFTKGTAGSLIYALLVEGKHTKADIETKLGLEGKSTVGTFIGDLQRAPGTYSVSRGIKVLKDAKGVLTLEGVEPVKKGKK